jgi:S-methylmethionine-dependent homocysteine/selenocysteine methylase
VDRKEYEDYERRRRWRRENEERHWNEMRIATFAMEAAGASDEEIAAFVGVEAGQSRDFLDRLDSKIEHAWFRFQVANKTIAGADAIAFRMNAPPGVCRWRPALSQEGA